MPIHRRGAVVQGASTARRRLARVSEHWLFPYPRGTSGFAIGGGDVGPSALPGSGRAGSADENRQRSLPARFARRSTLMDLIVRDTWDITPTRSR